MKYRKKPVEVDALQWDGSDHAAADIVNWIQGGGGTAVFFPREPFVSDVQPAQGAVISIATLEGTMRALPSDWIIRGVQGEFYPCKPVPFAATYDAVETQPDPIAEDIATVLTSSADSWDTFAYARESDGYLIAQTYDEAGEVDRTYRVQITVSDGENDL